MIQRRLADIDRHHFGVRVHERENGRLVCATTRDQNVKIGLVLPIRPQNPMCVAGVEPLPVASEPWFEVLYRLWVPVSLVLASDDIVTRIIAHFCTDPFTVNRRFKSQIVLSLAETLWVRGHLLNSNHDPGKGGNRPERSRSVMRSNTTQRFHRVSVPKSWRSARIST